VIDSLPFLTRVAQLVGNLIPSDKRVPQKVLFVADKLAWDQPGTPPYAHDLQTALAQSLDQATLFFLTYLWERRDSLLVIHPWLREAVHDLCRGDS
jgi:HD superfamily phosphohydrolase YqeK